MAFAESPTADNLSSEFMRQFIGVAAEVNPLTQSKFAAWMNQRFPLRRIGRELFCQQHFDAASKEVFRRGILGREPLRTRAAAMSPKARRQYLGVVKYQQIAGPQQLRKVAKYKVAEAIVTAAEMQQPRSRPVGQRPLRDQFIRQAIIEIGDKHKAIMTDRTYITLGCSSSPFRETVS